MAIGDGCRLLHLCVLRKLPDGAEALLGHEDISYLAALIQQILTVHVVRQYRKVGVADDRCSEVVRHLAGGEIIPEIRIGQRIRVRMDRQCPVGLALLLIDVHKVIEHILSRILSDRSCLRLDRPVLIQ